jgi:hypothetical protein
MFRLDCRRDALETPWKKALKMLPPPLKATSPSRKGLPSCEYLMGPLRQPDTRNYHVVSEMNRETSPQNRENAGSSARKMWFALSSSTNRAPRIPVANSRPA